MSHHPHDRHSHHGQPNLQPANAPFPPHDRAGISPEEREIVAATEDVDLAAQLENARAEINALKTRIAQLTDQALRAQAEVQNTRRRAEEDIVKNRKFAIESFAESLLPVLDSLEAALAVQDITAAQLREGSEATFKQLSSALERNQVAAIAPAPGSRFDPTRQQAISVMPADQEPNTIVSMLQKGYLIADRVLRPALVIVTAPK